MNLLNLRRRVRRRTGIENTSALANSAIDQDLNEAYRILSSIIAQFNEDFFEEQNVKFNLGLNSGLYSMPPDLIKFKQLRLAYTAPDSDDDYVIANEYDPSEVENVSADEVSATASNPIVDISNNYFRVWPRPTSAITNGGKLFYIALPSALVNTGDSPIISTQYHDPLTAFAALMPCANNVQDKKYVIYLKEWNDALERLEKQVQPRNINRYRRFRNVSEVGQRSKVRELPNNW